MVCMDDDGFWVTNGFSDSEEIDVSLVPLTCALWTGREVENRVEVVVDEDLVSRVVTLFEESTGKSKLETV